MATIYVSKSGSDSNNGSSYALSKLTIQAAVTASANGGTVIVGSGLYNEKVVQGSKAINYYADGVVISDGTNLPSTYAFYALDGYYINLFAYSTGGQWLFQNHIADTVCRSASLATNNISDSIFLSNGNNYAFTTGYAAVATFTRCIMSNFVAPVVCSASGSTTFLFYNCTFYKGTTAISINQPNCQIIISQCIFSDFTTAWQVYLAGTIIYLNDNLYYNITNYKIGASTYTTLAQVQALNPNYDSRSIVANPNFTDPTNNIFYLKSAVAGLPYVGAYPYSYTRGGANDSDGKWNISAVADNSGWYNPDGNVLKDANGYLYLHTGTTGILWQNVVDLGASQQISQVDIEASQIWGAGMIDTTKTDTLPNYQTCEIRASNTIFDQDDAVIPWTEVKLNMPFSTITGRYVQVRLTLRTDDLSA